MTSISRDDSATRHLILGTAGHIDHGKTSLVKALTGVDTDRLPEERRRGMTIELGFAQLRLGDVAFGIVDVPGHERFVRTMVAGATGIDVALIVVAADDGVMPQTVEHVEILDLLGIRHAVVAVSKCDLVDEDTLELAGEEVSELLAKTSLSGAPRVYCSAVRGIGLDLLKQELVSAANRAVRNRSHLPFRMPIDRAFSVAGRGTVVTGSVLNGAIEAGEFVEILPVGERARIRSLQTHSEETNRVSAGQRAAMNLQGISRETVARGCELSAVGAVKCVRLIDAHLTCLRSHRKPIGNHARVRLCIGTREVPARVVSLSQRPIALGSSDFVQLRCTERVAAAFGQRFIVRDENAAKTAGGGVVLRASRRRISARMTEEVDGLIVLRNGKPIDRIAEAIRAARFESPANERLALDAGVAPADAGDLVDRLVADRRVIRIAESDRLLSTAYLESLGRRASTWLNNYHRRHADEPGCLLDTFTGWLERKSDRPVARVVLHRLTESGDVRVMGRYACLKAFAPALSAQDERVQALMLDAFRSARFQPPNEAAIITATGANPPRIRKLLKVACSIGSVVRIDDSLHLLAEHESELRTITGELYATGGPFTVSELRQTLDSSRKYVVPLAEYLDRIGFTRRCGDKREVITAETT